jgi:hypothetical protein
VERQGGERDAERERKREREKGIDTETGGSVWEMVERVGESKRKG